VEESRAKNDAPKETMMPSLSDVRRCRILQGRQGWPSRRPRGCGWTSWERSPSRCRAARSRRWQRRRTRRMASVRTAGWCPLRSGKASPSRPSSGTLACNLRAFAQGVCRRRDSARPCGGGADGRGLRGASSQRNAAHTGPGHAAAAGGTRAGVLLACHVGGPAGDGDRGDPHERGDPRPHPGAAQSWSNLSPR